MLNKYKNLNSTLIATIGPSCDSLECLLELKKAGVDIFRVNMSHSTIEELKKYSKIGLENNIRIGLDTEGAQIRTNLKGKGNITIKKGDIIEIYDELDSKTNSKAFALYPNGTVSQLVEGCLIRLDFNGASIVVEKKKATMDSKGSRHPRTETSC